MAHLMVVHHNIATVDPNDFCLAGTVYDTEQEILDIVLPMIAREQVARAEGVGTWNQAELDAGRYHICSHEEWVNHLAKMDVTGCKATVFLDALDVKTFDPFVLEWNLSRAKDIQKKRTREHRIKALGALDVEFQRAQETGADTTAIVAKKQVLRDMPATIDSKTTLKTIKEVWSDDFPAYSTMWSG